MQDTQETADTVQDAGKKLNLKREIFGWLEALVGAVIIVGLIITFVGRPILVSGHSMENTLMDQDRIIITPLYWELKHNDIVVVRRKDDIPLVKRVVGMAGDTIDFDWETGVTLLNGEPLEEPFIREPMTKPRYPTIEFPVTVPEGYIFVMGDNRNNSSDSRSQDIGLVNLQEVMGKAVFQIWPLSRFGTLEDYTY